MSLEPLIITMKIYTKTGDKGKTSLYDGSRVVKSDDIFSLLGEVDELSSRIGVVVAHSKKGLKDIDEQLRNIQSNLQNLNSHIATIKPNKRHRLVLLDEKDVKSLETFIDVLDSKNKKLTSFILPGNTPLDSFIHLCRTQSRKVERLMWLMHNDDSNKVTFSEFDFQYTNRLSDFFFVLSRYIAEEDCFSYI